MTSDRCNGPLGRLRPSLRLLTATAAIAVMLPAAFGTTAQAQSMMRPPTVRIDPPRPTLQPTVTPRVTPTVTPRVTPTITPRVTPTVSTAARPINPNIRYPVDPGYTGPDGSGPNGAGSGGPPDQPPSRGAARNGGAGRNPVLTTGAIRSVPNELVVEVDGTPSDSDVAALARRHRLTRLESQSFPLIGSTMFRWRIADGRSVDTVIRQLTADGSVKSVQRNYRFALQQAAAAAGDPAQYALSRLNLPQAHALSNGRDVTIAVIDSGIDVAHPELAGVIAGSYDALKSKEGAHAHGTGIAGAIAAHARLMGSAPSSRILAIRAFGVAQGGAESTSFVILKSLNYAVEQNAKIINMSFAGPNDPLMERALAAAAARGVVLVAAAGNAGAKSPPLYPAADRNVIAVSATDGTDRLFVASNRGPHIAVAAPGVDVLLPSPDNKYQLTSGTSFSAAYVSGVVALMLERNPALRPDAVRATLMATARDLGAPGRDEQFGAGLADALAAVQAVTASATASAAPPAPRPVTDETRAQTPRPVSADAAPAR